MTTTSIIANAALILGIIALFLFIGIYFKRRYFTTREEKNRKNPSYYLETFFTGVGLIILYIILSLA